MTKKLQATIASINTSITSSEEKRESAPISNDSTTLQQVSMGLDNLPLMLPKPQSWAERMIQNATNLDFTLNPRPTQNGEIPLLPYPVLDSKYRGLLAFTALRAGYDPKRWEVLQESASVLPSVVNYFIILDFPCPKIKT